MKKLESKKTAGKILVGILAGVMIFGSATAVSAASGWSRSTQQNQWTGNMGGMMTAYTAKTNALSCADLTGGIVSSEDLFSKRPEADR